MTPRPLPSLALLAGILLWAGTASAQATDGPTVVVSGQATVMAVPDRASISVSVESRAVAQREAQGKTAAAMKAVQDRLRALRVPADAVRTTSVNLYIDADFVNGSRVTKGYVASNAIDVRLDAIDRVGEIVDAVVAAGATSVSDVRFDVKNRGVLEREALKLAVQDARARADALALGAGKAVDRVLRIEEEGVQVPGPMPVRAMAMREAAAAETPVAAGQMEFRARVTLTATLK
ncbi:MAG: SIMPL domain-containing protein [Vicinamibacterales bacterium]|nr:SIMPL domain-containing protein [Vicinamibacterales bacterium]